MFLVLIQVLTELVFATPGLACAKSNRARDLIFLLLVRIMVRSPVMVTIVSSMGIIIVLIMASSLEVVVLRPVMMAWS